MTLNSVIVSVTSIYNTTKDSEMIGESGTTHVEVQVVGDVQSTKT